MPIFLILVGLAAAAYLVRHVLIVRYWAGVKNRLRAMREHEPALRRAIESFDELIRRDWYVSDRDFRIWQASYADLDKRCEPAFSKVNIGDTIQELVRTFARYYHYGRADIEAHNAMFIMDEAPRIEGILDSRSIQHNADQVNAIASDEDNTLLVAGAGTGKTTTILGKLAYLIERVGVKDEELLLLSFTGRAVDELSERIARKFPGRSIEATTFHSFGLSVIGAVRGTRPTLAFPTSAGRQEFLDQALDRLLLDPAYQHRAVEYFAYYFRPVVLKPGFASLDDYYKNAKKEEHLTLRKEQLKSQQEVMIANFLFMNGVAYEYERPYAHQTADKDYQQYKPDFYLPGYGLYLEHFGVDRKGETHFTVNEHQRRLQTERYRKDMQWKRSLHARHGTKLIETYSFEFAEGTWKQHLTEQLRARGVAMRPRDMLDVLTELRASGKVKEIAQLFGTFLSLAKAQGYKPEKLRDIVKGKASGRERAFLDIFEPVYVAHEDYLARTGMIDFDDMLLASAEYIRNNTFIHPFRYIIIDEFQDFSVSKYHLIKALCDQRPETKLFCVGDDWQSIFRFSGSDISLMSNFKESYGFTRQNELALTNRFADGLATITNRFILKNPEQIQKQVRSARHEAGNPLEIRYRNKSGGDALLRELLSTISARSHAGSGRTNVFFLGRYRHNKPKEFLQYVKEYPSLQLEYLTIHASKGSEADYVIILDAISGKLGLPSEITDDPLLELVLSKADAYPHAEERRLMYVAMTRARKKVFIVTEYGNESVFVQELEGGAVAATNTAHLCDACGGVMKLRQGPRRQFWGCSNFPECRHTASYISDKAGVMG